jgi:hypothetical protein
MKFHVLFQRLWDFGKSLSGTFGTLQSSFLLLLRLWKSHSGTFGTSLGCTVRPDLFGLLALPFARIAPQQIKHAIDEWC